MGNVTALIVAAGSGQRMGGNLPKQYRPLAGKPILRHAVEALIGHPRIDRVRVVVGEGQINLARPALGNLEVGEPIIGGERRGDSVRAGLAAIGDGVVLVHDAARPFCPPAVIDRLLDAVETNDGAVPVLAVADTLAKGDVILGERVERDGLLRVQTPQAFRRAALAEAMDAAGAASATDESSAMVAAGHRIAAVAGDPLLDKLTTLDDLMRAEQRLAATLISRSGMGFDVHRFAGEGPVMIGGIAIPHPRGLAGHSDADVVLHAITDALLGAAVLGDIGDHFPPSDPQWKGAASELFLRHAASLIEDRGGLIDHVDCTVICESPRIGPHRQAMRERVAQILDLALDAVSIKATTTEQLGFTGRGEGIAAQAIATVRLPPTDAMRSR